MSLGAQVFAELVPELQALDGQGNLGGLTALPPDGAPSPAGGLVGDLALFKKDDVGATLGEVVGGSAAGDSSAYDYNVGLSCHS